MYTSCSKITFYFLYIIKCITKFSNTILDRERTIIDCESSRTDKLSVAQILTNRPQCIVFIEVIEA